MALRLITLLKENSSKAIKDFSFILKFVALLFNVLNILAWRIPKDGITGHVTTLEKCLFAHTVPAYMVILSGFILTYLMGDRPGPWFQTLFLLTGVSLFLTTGTIALINRVQDTTMGVPPFIIAGLCFIIGVILLIDHILNVRKSPCFKRRDKSH